MVRRQERGMRRPPDRVPLPKLTMLVLMALVMVLMTLAQPARSLSPPALLTPLVLVMLRDWPQEQQQEGRRRCSRPASQPRAMRRARARAMTKRAGWGE